MLYYCDKLERESNQMIEVIDEHFNEWLILFDVIIRKNKKQLSSINQSKCLDPFHRWLGTRHLVFFILKNVSHNTSFIVGAKPSTL